MHDTIIRFLVMEQKHRPLHLAWGSFMPMLFHICRKGSPARWTVLIEGQLYGEYLDKEQAVTDALEAAIEAQEAGCIAEVWEGAVRVF